MSTDTILGNGIVRNTARPLAIFVDSNNNEYVCDKVDFDLLDPSRSFEDQIGKSCEVNPFDIGG